MKVLNSAEKRKSYVNLALNARLTDNLTKQDRARITDLVYGTSRHLGTIDRHLAPHSKRDLKDLPGPIRAILRLALYELLCTPRHLLRWPSIRLLSWPRSTATEGLLP
ncbi:MAG: transcription antitermination protein NusB [Limnochordia bacterium]